jgi:hypothetical protein
MTLSISGDFKKQNPSYHETNVLLSIMVKRWNNGFVIVPFVGISFTMLF